MDMVSGLCFCNVEYLLELKQGLLIIKILPHVIVDGEVESDLIYLVNLA